MRTTLMLKGSRSRKETDLGEGQRSVVIVDHGAGTIVTLDEAQKEYTWARIEPDTGEKPPAPPPVPPSEKPTGKSETVAGRRCDHYMDADTRLDFCVASGMGYFAAGTGTPPGPEWDARRKAFPGGWFPLKVELESVKGRAAVMVVDRIEAKPLPDSLFAPPDGYQRMRVE